MGFVKLEQNCQLSSSYSQHFPRHQHHHLIDWIGIFKLVSQSQNKAMVGLRSDNMMNELITLDPLFIGDPWNQLKSSLQRWFFWHSPKKYRANFSLTFVFFRTKDHKIYLPSSLICRADRHTYTKLDHPYPLPVPNPPHPCLSKPSRLFKLHGPCLLYLRYYIAV